jgi:hypothetical protein
LPKIALVVGLALAWVTVALFWPLGGVVWLASAVYLVIRRRRWAAISLALSPYVALSMMSLFLGFFGYVNGTARFRYFGLPGCEFSNLDSDYRVYRSSSGCIVDGSEIFTQTPNNFAIRTLVRAFGPMRGVYTGPYPDKDEAANAISNSPIRLKRSEVARPDLAIAGARVHLAPAAIDDLKPDLETADDDEIRAAIFRGACLLIELPRPNRNHHLNEKTILLIDLQRGEVFARYGL